MPRYTSNSWLPIWVPNLRAVCSHRLLKIHILFRLTSLFLFASQPAAVIAEPVSTEHSDREKLYMWAKFDYEDARYSEALSEISKYLATYPKDSSALALRALIYARLGKSVQAYSEIEEAMKVSPKNATWLVYDYRGLIDLQMGRFAQAISNFSKSIDLTEEWRPFFHRAIACMKLSKWNNALSDFDSSVRLYEKSPEVHYYRALVEERLGNSKAALSDLTIAMALCKERTKHPKAEVPSPPYGKWLQIIEAQRESLQHQNRASLQVQELDRAW